MLQYDGYAVTHNPHAVYHATINCDHKLNVQVCFATIFFTFHALTLSNRWRRALSW